GLVGKAMPQDRDAYALAISAGRGQRAVAKCRVCVDIRNLRDAALEDCASRGTPSARGGGIGASVHLDDVAGGAMVCHEVEELAVEPVDEAVLGLAEPPRALSDHVEYRLDVGRRAGDDVEHLASGGRGFLRICLVCCCGLRPPRQIAVFAWG